MQIMVKGLTGRVLKFDFEPSTQFIHVKEQLQEKEGIDVSQIRILFGGAACEDTATLESKKVVAGSTLHMVLSLRGGSA